MKKTLLIISLFILVTTLNVFSQYYTESKTPQRIIINLTATPATSMAVTWRTVDAIDNAVVEVAEAKAQFRV